MASPLLELTVFVAGDLDGEVDISFGPIYAPQLIEIHKTFFTTTTVR